MAYQDLIYTIFGSAQPAIDESVFLLILPEMLDRIRIKQGAQTKWTHENYLLVLKMRFGLGDTPQKSLDECGEYFGVTGGRIRQVLELALRALRHPAAVSRYAPQFYDPD